MPLDFAEVLKEKQQLVWPEIKRYLDIPGIDVSSKYKKELEFHQRMISDYPERKGKYLRPTLLLLCASAMGFPEEKAIKTAAAIQVSEDWMLIHDDFEDDSEERRGKPALHKIFGSEMATNAGDALHILMWKILQGNKKVLGCDKTFAVMDEFAQILSRTAFGQTIEIKWTKENREDLSDDDCLFITDGKTVHYSIAGPMRLGAILSGATREQLESLSQFARPLGRCFQLKDDLLDLTSDFSGLKKQCCNDLYEGKRTIVLMHVLRSAKSLEKEKIRRIMEKDRKEKTKEEIAWILSLMKKYGSLDYTQKLAEGFAKDAREIFEKKLGFLKNQPARDQLISGIDFILNRKH